MGWDNIHREFNEKTGRGYEKKQLKNRLDNLRKEWKTFDKLIAKETGIGWDPERNIVVASDECWGRKLRENLAYEKFRHYGLRFRTKLEIIFKDTIASGDDMWAPSWTKPAPQRGVSDYLDGINLTANTSNTAPTVPSTSGSQGKRKRGEGLDKYKKKKMPTTRRIADAVSLIEKASISTAEAIDKISNIDNTTELTADLLSMPEIVSDTHLCVICYNLLANKMFREIYAGLRENQEVLVAWLKHNAANLPPYIAPKNP
ncbi:uncharacterized protein LOC114752138 [Neltuma alba]|uniref:uncharacterized protein LOC114752138 n=1 Tax=Neltuma alba TaxID=207710 RepID=UPI0010A30A98|nr:uncharacterized protein LOC114752138 [Prosopis alba]